MRPSVRPGATLLRRDATHLQVGTDPGVIVRDRPGLYPLLLSLDGVRDIASLRRHARQFIPELGEDVADVLAPLLSAGVVVDYAVASLPPLRVDIAHHGLGTQLAAVIAALLDGLGVAVGPEPDLTIIVSVGEPSRAALADAVRCRVNHLPVVLDADGVRIGPVVVPGRTPCVGCADLQRAAWDPAWLSLVPQFGRPTHGVAAVGRIAPEALLINQVAAAEVVACCLAFAQGKHGNELRTVSADRRTRVTAHAAFHPRCPCAFLSAA